MLHRQQARINTSPTLVAWLARLLRQEWCHVHHLDLDQTLIERTEHLDKVPVGIEMSALFPLACGPLLHCPISLFTPVSSLVPRLPSSYLRILARKGTGDLSAGLSQVVSSPLVRNQPLCVGDRP